MKKILIVTLSMFLSLNAEAQMADIMGTMAVDGALTQGDFKGVNTMQQAFDRMQFQQDLAMLNAEIQTTFIGNYDGINKDLLGFQGLKGISWNVVPVSSEQYYIELTGLDGPTCFLCKNPEWRARKVEINGGTECQGSGNNVKMYF